MNDPEGWIPAGWLFTVRETIKTLESKGVKVHNIGTEYGYLRIKFSTNLAPNPQIDGWAEDIVDKTIIKCKKLCKICEATVTRFEKYCYRHKHLEG